MTKKQKSCIELLSDWDWAILAILIVCAFLYVHVIEPRIHPHERMSSGYWKCVDWDDVLPEAEEYLLYNCNKMPAEFRNEAMIITSAGEQCVIELERAPIPPIRKVVPLSECVMQFKERWDCSVHPTMISVCVEDVWTRTRV